VSEKIDRLRTEVIEHPG